MAKFDPIFLDRIRAAVPISDVIGKRVMWDKRKSNTRRGDHWAPCPFHGEKSPSFHCEDGKGRYHCFGCGASGDHFRFLTEMDGLSFPQAVSEIANMAGIPMPGRDDGISEAERAERRAEWERKKARERAAAEAEEQERVQSAGGLWRGTKPTAGTLADVYALARGLPAWDDPNVRFHPRCWHEHMRIEAPAVVGRVQGPDGKGRAVWRIYLKPDGSDKLFSKAESAADRGKISKVGKGPAGGGAVRLGGDAETIGIGEGLETCRAAFLLDGRFPVWAGLSTGGIIGFEPPSFVKRILIYPDGDKPRRRDGVDYGPPGMEAALTLKGRMDERGLPCEIVEPPPPGMDYLDLWNARQRELA